MTQRFKAACIQNCATPDIGHDIAVLTRLIGQAAAAGAKFIATPEYCAGLDTKDGLLHPVAPPEAEHPVIPAMTALARKHGIWLLIGSIGVAAGHGRINNRSFMLAPDGSIAARYDKLHLFDVDLGEGRVYRESATIAPGSEAVVSPLLGSSIGLAICYDLRFAGLFRTLAQAGARLLAVPAAFTKVTGEAHWHILNRARAIENGAFVISPCQYGTLAGGSRCYGHSLIVDPWGNILADGGESEGFVLADLDLALADDARRRIPALRHDRPYSLHGLAQAAE